VLTAERRRTTIGRVIFNQILPDALRFRDAVMRRSDLKELVDECYRQLGPEETAHLVDGIKSVGFEFATRGGMTIGLFDIEIPTDKGDRLKAPTTRWPRSTASTSAASSPMTSATSRSSGCGRRPARRCPTR
jgi:DNA-directed RNA polymerase beta' subunit